MLLAVLFFRSFYGSSEPGTPLHHDSFPSNPLRPLHHLNFTIRPAPHLMLPAACGFASPDLDEPHRVAREIPARRVAILRKERIHTPFSHWIGPLVRDLVEM